MTDKTLLRILEDVVRCPLPLRIAWLLHRKKFTEATFIAFCQEHQGVSDVVINQVWSELRSIENGFYRLDFLAEVPDIAYKELKDGQ